jgi:hypothetical protein
MAEITRIDRVDKQIGKLSLTYRYNGKVNRKPFGVAWGSCTLKRFETREQAEDYFERIQTTRT